MIEKLSLDFHPSDAKHQIEPMIKKINEVVDLLNEILKDYPRIKHHVNMNSGDASFRIILEPK